MKEKEAGEISFNIFYVTQYIQSIISIYNQCKIIINEILYILLLY